MTDNQKPLVGPKGTRTGRLRNKSGRTVRGYLNIILYDSYQDILSFEPSLKWTNSAKNFS